MIGRLVRAALAGIGTACDTLVPGPNIHGYRLDWPESPLVEREAEEEVAEPDWRAALNGEFSGRRPGLGCSGGPIEDLLRTIQLPIELQHWKVGDKYCGACGANITAVTFHARPLRAQSPAANAGSGESDPAGVSAGPTSPAPPAGRTLHCKTETCWCGENLSAEGSEEAVILASRNFRLYHSHRNTQK